MACSAPSLHPPPSTLHHRSQIEVSVSSQLTGDNFGRKKRLHVPRTNTWIPLLTRSQLRQLGLSRNTPITRIRIGVLANHSGGVNSKICALRISRLVSDGASGVLSSADALVGHTAALPTAFLSFTATVACLQATTMSVLATTAASDALRRSTRTGDVEGGPEAAPGPSATAAAASAIVSGIVRELEAQVACLARAGPVAAVPLPFLSSAGPGGAGVMGSGLVVDTSAPVHTVSLTAFQDPGATQGPSDGLGQETAVGGATLSSAPLCLLRLLHDVVHCSSAALHALAAPGSVARLVTAVSKLGDVGDQRVWFQCQLVLLSLLRTVLPSTPPSLPLAIAHRATQLHLPVIEFLCALAGVGSYTLTTLAAHGITYDDLVQVDSLVEGGPRGAGEEDSKTEHHCERESKGDEGAGEGECRGA